VSGPRGRYSLCLPHPHRRNRTVAVFIGICAQSGLRVDHPPHNPASRQLHPGCSITRGADPKSLSCIPEQSAERPPIIHPSVDFLRRPKTSCRERTNPRRMPAENSPLLWRYISVLPSREKMTDKLLTPAKVVERKTRLVRNLNTPSLASWRMLKNALSTTTWICPVSRK
jgi:hypothetical protein